MFDSRQGSAKETNNPSSGPASSGGATGGIAKNSGLNDVPPTQIAPETKSALSIPLEGQKMAEKALLSSPSQSPAARNDLDLANLAVPRLQAGLIALPEIVPSSKALKEAPPARAPRAEETSSFLRNTFPLGRAAYDFYFGAGGVIRESLETATYTAGWISGLSVMGATVATFGLAPVPVLGAVAAGVGTYKAAQFVGGALTDAIWGQSA
jgi:hypothetical protein